MRIFVHDSGHYQAMLAAAERAGRPWLGLTFFKDCYKTSIL
jgi:hypothetical protein